MWKNEENLLREEISIRISKISNALIIHLIIKKKCYKIFLIIILILMKQISHAQLLIFLDIC